MRDLDAVPEHAIRERIERLRERIGRAAARAGSSPDAISVVAATKGVPAQRVAEAVRAGLDLVGENRVQEALSKVPELKSLLPASRAAALQVHMIGRLQTNKARYCPGFFDMIQSVDSLKLGQRLNYYAEKAGVVLPVLVEVNVGGEPGKAGVRPEELEALVMALADLPALRVQGLMAVPPVCEHPEQARQYFRRMRSLFRELERRPPSGVEPRYLSMGMSADFEVAIEEGSNMIRVGTAIFGPRPR